MMELGPQCWKCCERRVRCGSETPKCAKCEVKGFLCPGYGSKKPLRWRKPQIPSVMVKCQKEQDNKHVAPDLVPIDSPSNPFRWSLNATADAPLFLNYVHASISAFHRIVRRRLGETKTTPSSSQSSELLIGSIPSDPEESTFCHYRASALRGLNDALSKDTWNVNPRVSFVLSNVLVIDVISVTTTPVEKMTSDTVKWHLAYLKGLPHVDYTLSPTPTPIPQDLLKPTIMVNLARASSRQIMGAAQSPLFPLSEVLAELGVVYPWHHVPERASSHHALTETAEVPDCSDTVSGYALFLRCFRFATILYTIEGYTSLELKSGTHQDVALTPSTLQDIQSSAYSSLLHSLRTVFQDKANPQCKEGYWKFIFWPLTVAGVQSVIVKRDRNDLEYICMTLHEMAADLGTLSMRDAALFLHRLWNETSAMGPDGTLMTWDDVFADAPLFLL
ncbi:hypothetical protein BDV06DRAFT_216466 [Aspergillus oleicola]